MTMQKIIKTEILGQDLKSIQKASNFLTNNELVSFPTETVYGLGASAMSNIGVAKIFAAKGRPKYNPLIIHIANKNDVHNWAFVPQAAEDLIEDFWPGPLTLVFNKKESDKSIASLVTGNLKTIAIRVPLHPIARALIKNFGYPIAAPSANISGTLTAGTLAVTSLDITGTVTAATVDVNGGNLDNVTIGSATPGAATFNALTVNNSGGAALATIDAGSGNATLNLDASGSSQQSRIEFDRGTGSAEGFIAYSHNSTSTSEKLQIQVGTKVGLTILGNGNVGFGPDEIF